MWFDRFRSTLAKTTLEEPPTPAPRRATRFRLDLPIAFLADDRRHEGHSINVSASGLLAKFTEVPDLWISGKLELEAGEHYLSIHARVARLQDTEAGFAFLFDTEHDRAAVAILLQSVSDRPLGEPVES